LICRSPTFPVCRTGRPSLRRRSGRPARSREHGLRCLELTLPIHLGTHLDAPSHFLADGGTIDQVGLDTLVGPPCGLIFGLIGALSMFSAYVAVQVIICRNK